MQVRADGEPARNGSQSPLSLWLVPVATVSPARRVRLAGILVLALGALAAAIALAQALRAGTSPAPDAPGLARSEARALERLGGKATARTVVLDGWLASLWHGERLGWTLAGLALVVGGVCLHIAGLMEETVAGATSPAADDGPRARP